MENQPETTSGHHRPLHDRAAATTTDAAADGVATAPQRCPRCGTELAPGLRACPSCGRLVHAAQLEVLADRARRATEAGDPTAALAEWREALDLLPPTSRQHAVIAGKVEALSREIDAGGGGGAGVPVPPQRAPTAVGAGSSAPSTNVASGAKKAAVAAGGIALLLWKFKFVLAFVLTKGKLLLLGLTKGSTLFSMLLSVGVYWTIWGWRFALGLVLSIYIHEMGHVAALRRFGFKATAPMFIPGLGAFIRLKQHPANPIEDARVGLAGPIWGLGAAVASLGLWLVTGHDVFAAIGKVGAWVNLFNLLPLYPLDGGRAFAALSRRQRWLMVAAIAAAWFFSAEGLLVLLLIVALARALGKGHEPGDRTTAIHYVGLLVMLTLISTIKAGVEGR